MLRLENGLCSCKHRPYPKKTNGGTQNIVAMAAVIMIAIFEPRPEYIWVVNKGIQPEAVPRKNVTAAKTEDA